MFARKPNPEVVELNAEITRVHSQLGQFAVDSKEYKAAVDAMSVLYAQKEKITASLNRITKDQVVAVTGNLLGILTIVIYEKHDVFTSQARGFIGKFRS